MLCVCVRVCTRERCGYACSMAHMEVRGQLHVVKFSPSAFTRVLRVQLKLPGVCGNSHHPLSCLTSCLQKKNHIYYLLIYVYL